jgi:hypothetical protein
MRGTSSADDAIRYLSRYARDPWGDVTAFDIETQTEGEPFVYPNGTNSLTPVGLDPRVSRITTISTLSLGERCVVMDGGQHDLELIENFVALNGQPRGILLGWNSTFFDLPFMKVRQVGRSGSKDFSFSSYPNWMTPKYGFPEWADYVAPLGGQWHFAQVGRADHYDIAPLFKRFAERNGIKHSLKPVCEFLGIEMVTVDASQMERLTRTERIEYNLSDCNGIIELFKWMGENVDQLLSREDDQ